MIVKLLRGFAYVWSALSMLLIGIGLIGIWVKSGFGEVQRIFSPWNLWNWGLIMILISPAVGATMLADRLERRRRSDPPK